MSRMACRSFRSAWLMYAESSAPRRRRRRRFAARSSRPARNTIRRARNSIEAPTGVIDAWLTSQYARKARRARLQSDGDADHRGLANAEGLGKPVADAGEQVLAGHDGPG